MPQASASRTIAAPVADVWAIVGDPYHLPRWWPRAERVEDVHPGQSGGKRATWILVLTTDSGRGLRAQYRCTAAAKPKHYAWEQAIEDTPFAKILRWARTEIRLEPAGDGQTRVTIVTAQRLRGLAWLGSFLMRRATARQLRVALEGLEHALVGEP